MITNEIIESINAFVANNKPFKSVYEAYNAWSIHTGYIINNSKSVQWITNYFSDLFYIQKTSLFQEIDKKNHKEGSHS